MSIWKLTQPLVSLKRPHIMPRLIMAAQKCGAPPATAWMTAKNYVPFLAGCWKSIRDTSSADNAIAMSMKTGDMELMENAIEDGEAGAKFKAVRAVIIRIPARGYRPEAPWTHRA
jgi:hypothetical protein